MVQALHKVGSAGEVCKGGDAAIGKDPGRQVSVRGICAVGEGAEMLVGR